MAKEVAKSVVLFVKLSVAVALLGVAVGLFVFSSVRPVEVPDDDLPDRATESPGITWDEIRESPVQYDDRTNLEHCEHALRTLYRIDAAEARDECARDLAEAGSEAFDATWRHYQTGDEK